MTTQEQFEKIEQTFEYIKTNYEQWKNEGNKNAARRARVGSVQIGKEFANFRKLSVEETK